MTPTTAVLDRDAYRARLDDPHREVRAKVELLEEACRGRRVLDLGCIDHSWRTALELGDDWLHARLARVADAIVGVDILSGDAARLRERGFDIRVADVETLDLGETFEVIVAGDLIEHLTRPGAFLEAVARHCGPDTRVYVSTPNPFNVEQLLHIVSGRGPCVNAEHVAWFDPEVLWTLVERSPLGVTDACWVDTRFHFDRVGGRFGRRLGAAVVRWSMRRWPRLRRDLLVELALDGTGSPPEASPPRPEMESAETHGLAEHAAPADETTVAAGHV